GRGGVRRSHGVAFGGRRGLMPGLRHGAARPGQALRRLRPLARRRARILRPSAVFMRARKPWSRLRLRLLGWKVRLVAMAAALLEPAKRPSSLAASPGPRQLDRPRRPGCRARVIVWPAL